MTVEVKLFATLRKYLPSDGDGKTTTLDLPAPTRVGELLGALNIPDAEVQLVLINGQHTPDRSHAIEQDCTVSIFPAMAGGASGSGEITDNP